MTLKKILVIIGAVFIGLIALAVVGSFLPEEQQTTQTAPPPAAEAPAQEPEEQAPLYTAAEQEIIDYCSEWVEEMDDIITEIQVVLDSSSYASYNDMGKDILKLVKRYQRIDTSYKRTNGGDYAGGQVEDLETMWERIGNNVRVTLRVMAQCLTEPEKANVERAAKALVNAEEEMPKLRAELDYLTSY